MTDYPRGLLQAILPTMEELFARLDAEEERTAAPSATTGREGRLCPPRVQSPRECTAEESPCRFDTAQPHAAEYECPRCGCAMCEDATCDEEICYGCYLDDK